MNEATKAQKTASPGFCFLIFTSHRELFCDIWCFCALVAGIEYVLATIISISNCDTTKY